MKKTFGWVIEMKKDNANYSGFYQRYYCGSSYSGPLLTAFVCSGRQLAREMTNSDEVTRKVSLYRNGKAKKIIGRG